MINLFNFANDDKSLVFLGQIFGSMNGVIPFPAGEVGGTAPGTVSMLGTMFFTFNSVVLAVGALIVVYIIVFGVLATAQEGEFLGKKWNSFWVPLRTIIGIVALVPTSAGYSALQILMMWVIVQGIGAADTLWNTAISFVNVLGSPTAQLSIPTTQVTQTLGSLFQALVCDASAKVTSPNPYGAGLGYYCAINVTDTNFCSSGVKFDPNLPQVNLGPGASCGSLRFCDQKAVCSTNPNSLDCLTCGGQVAALTNIIPTLSTIAQQYVQLDLEYQNFYNQSALEVANPPSDGKNKAKPPSWVEDYCSKNNISPCTAPNLPNPQMGQQGPSDDAVKNLYWTYGLSPAVGSANFINVSSQDYVGQLTQQIMNFIQQQGQSNTPVNNALASAQNVGWIFAGAYYYEIARANKSVQMSVPSFIFNAPDQPLPNTTNLMSHYRNNFSAATLLINAAAGSGSSGLPSQMGQLAGPLSSMTGDVNNILQATISSPTGMDPVSQLQAAGTALLLVVSILFPVLFALTIAIGIAGNIDVFVLGTGVMNPIGPAMTLVYILVIPALYFLLGIMLTLGGTLAVYVPLIPYIIFSFGAIAWFISTIEAMVAGPLVALGILAPGQHEGLLGEARHGLMMLFNIFLRPSLMIFGLIAAMFLAKVVLTMINYAFWSIVAPSVADFANTSGNNNTGNAGGIAALALNPLELIFFLCAYVSLIVSALNKCFAVIHIIPERVITWIGGHGGHAGEAEAVQEHKQAVAGATSKAGGGYEKAAGKAETSAQAKDKETKARKEGPPSVSGKQ